MIFALLSGMCPSEFTGVEYPDLSLETYERDGLERGRGAA